MIVLNILLRIHRKLKEAAVFRYTKKVDKDDGSVSILVLPTITFFIFGYLRMITLAPEVTIDLNPGEE